jgi:type I restriction enzyme M protein
MDLLGRFYTKSNISDLLVNSLSSKEPKKILDLGIGNASLTISAYNRWSKAEYFATEIEQSKVDELTHKLSFLKIFQYDNLRPCLEPELKNRLGTIDLAICNPPYVKIADVTIYKDLFHQAECEKFVDIPQINSEIIFFAQNIALLKVGGELGIIVSDSLLTGKNYKIFRQILLSKFDLKSIIQLPDKVFSKTEARTHIVILSKRNSTKNTVNLYGVDADGELTEKISCFKKNLIERMDHQFHKIDLSIYTNQQTLSELNSKISRGKYTHKRLKELGEPYIHSNNILNSEFQESVTSNEPHSINAFALKGDIVICRVGKRCLGRVAQVTVNKVLISDCICKITVDKKYQNKVFKALKSEYGIKWINKYAHGVCAQVISKSDLMTLPVKL